MSTNLGELLAMRAAAASAAETAAAACERLLRYQPVVDAAIAIVELHARKNKTWAERVQAARNLKRAVSALRKAPSA